MIKISNRDVTQVKNRLRKIRDSEENPIEFNIPQTPTLFGVEGFGNHRRCVIEIFCRVRNTVSIQRFTRFSIAMLILLENSLVNNLG